MCLKERKEEERQGVAPRAKDRSKSAETYVFDLGKAVGQDGL